MNEPLNLTDAELDLLAETLLCRIHDEALEKFRDRQAFNEAIEAHPLRPLWKRLIREQVRRQDGAR